MRNLGKFDPTSIITPYVPIAEEKKGTGNQGLSTKKNVIAVSKMETSPSKKGLSILEEAAACWMDWDNFRRTRERNKRYTYGDQWHERISVNGVSMTEEDYIRQQGYIPLKNNLIRKMVRNVVGVFRNSYKPPEWPSDLRVDNRGEMNRRLLETSNKNRLEELYARSMEEFLISGVVIHRKRCGTKNGFKGCLTDAVAPDRFFLDTSTSDYRITDTNMVGELHDISFTSLCAMFASSPSDCNILRGIYAEYDTDFSSQFGDSQTVNPDFLSASKGRCRVVEVWKRENAVRWICNDPLKGYAFSASDDDYLSFVRKENQRRKNSGESRQIAARWRVEESWHYYFLSPAGHILAEGISPYFDAGHPYVFKAYPFIDGEVHSFVGDIIDQQRHTNRLITLYDWVMRSSAKGVLLFPENAIPYGADINEIASEWSRFNGVIVYQPQPGEPIPQQVMGNTSNLGISELLNLQLKLFEDISGVNGALQGKIDGGSTSGNLYNLQTNNALTSLADLIGTYRDFIEQCTRRDALNLLLK